MRFPPVSERFERLEEALQICMQMWSDDDGPFEGRHYQLAETICEPRPISRPRPPVMIGGSGERKTLRLVARYADACNLFAADPADGRAQARRAAPSLRQRAARLRHDQEDDPRDRAIRSPTPTRSSPEMREYADLGIDTVIFMPTGDPVDYTKRLGTDIAPRLGAL